MGRRKTAECLLQLVSGFMLRSMSASIQLEVCLDAQLPLAAGHYDRGEQTIIRVAQSQLADVTCLPWPTLARRAAHRHVARPGSLSAESRITNTSPTSCRFFSASASSRPDATVHEDHGRHGGYSRWTMGKSGYLPSHVFGYALRRSPSCGARKSLHGQVTCGRMRPQPFATGYVFSASPLIPFFTRHDPRRAPATANQRARWPTAHGALFIPARQRSGNR